MDQNTVVRRLDEHTFTRLDDEGQPGADEFVGVTTSG